ncbi:MAG: transglutaminase-like domain-containing protein [bacterium]|nr:transglutaminase-like domain-containing protein [bacterium]
MVTRLMGAALSCLLAAALPGCRHAPAWAGDGAARRFYRTQGPVTDPGRHAGLYAGLPRDVRGLCGVVQGVMLHVFWADRYGVTLPEERKREVNLRTVERMLARIAELDPRPLTARREPLKRLVGNCRDHAVLLCSMLRHAGIPARARCGFATYFTPGRHEDHWVVEHWDGPRGRWVRVDPQLDEVQVKALGIAFDPFDLPPGTFVPAGEAWRRCRAGTLDPDRCGIFDMHGLWFVRGNLVRDVMALNGLELLPWDWNALMSREREPTADEYRLLDRAAEATAGEVPFAEVRALHASEPALRMPPGWAP